MIRTVFIPNTICTLGANAFLNSEQLEEVVFESGSLVSSIGPRCFAKCNKLSQVSFGDLQCVRTFPAELFKDSGLRSICIPSSVRTLGPKCFAGCSNLSLVSFGNESCLKRIRDRAFKGCALTRFEAPLSLVALGSGVFSSCSKLTYVGLPRGIRFLGPQCFSECGKKLKDVDLPETISVIESNAFDDNCKVHMDCEDSEIVSAFEEWQLDRSGRFVNPIYECGTFIRGALVLCEDGFIGCGGQGSVKLKENMITGEILAVKTVVFGPRIAETRWEELKDRESKLQDLRCPCLVRLKGCYFDDQRHRMTMGMEYVACSGLDPPSSGGDEKPRGTSVSLKQVLERQPNWWTNKAKAIAILGVAHGIDYLHANGFIHRDLKPSNILFDEAIRPKICDFDVARSEAEDCSATMTMGVGTNLYMAPEVSSGHYNHKADFFSFGCILYEIFEGTESLVQQIQRLWTSGSVIFTGLTPARMREIIESCLCEDPDDRCGFLDESDSPVLMDSLWDAVRADMGLDATDVELVERYVRDIECDNDDNSSDLGDPDDGC